MMELSKLVSFNDDIAIGLSEKKGRLIIAQRNIKKGDLILKIAPSAAVLQPTEIDRYCSGCYQPTSKSKQLEKCPKCKKIFFCRTCKQREKLIHEESKECEYVQMRRGDDPFIRCLLRLCYFGTKGNLYPKDFPIIPTSLFDIIQSNSPNTQKNVGIVVDRWQDVLSLGIGANDPTFDLLPKLQLVSQLLPNSEPETLEKLLRILWVNAHEISHPGKPLGFGLYPTGALLNHSCKPNACFFHDNDGMMCFRAVRDIEKGKEICTTYIDVYKPRELRQMDLRRYDFECDCERCRDPQDDKIINGYICRNKSCGGILVVENDNLVCEKCASKVIKTLYDKAKEKIEQYHNEAVVASKKLDYNTSLKSLKEAVKVGQSFLHENHYLNYQNYNSIVTAFIELQQYEEAIPFIKRQIKCLQYSKDGTMTVQEAGRYRLLALTYQDWARDRAELGYNANELIDLSYETFVATKKRYEAFYGEKHWFTQTVQKAIDMFDGKCNSQELLDL